ncbi:MAG TPA: AraC family transcriptional regulator [Thermoclostridium sp.]|nr:AraC family transcriptional regulator [Thermoclostridium sp.]
MMELSTIGREFLKGYEIKLYCRRNMSTLPNDCLNQRCRIVYISEGFGLFRNGEQSQLVTAPAVICLNEREEVDIEEPNNIRLDILYFDPSCYDADLTFDKLHEKKDELGGDMELWYFRPFLWRNDSYIGAKRANTYFGSRISQLITLVDEELTHQRDGFWPCRGRSFFIELMLLVNSVFNNDEGYKSLVMGRMDDEIREIVNHIHIHYPEKITINDLTTKFHTNKTTLNQKFKKATGLTVMEYLTNLRMQITCSLLKRTTLTVNEIMERVGYRDETNLLRAFKKYANCTPSAYRTQYARI